MKTKLIPVALAAAVLLSGLAACAGSEREPEKSGTDSTVPTTAVVVRESGTTAKPFVEAQTSIISGPEQATSAATTTAAPVSTTVRRTEQSFTRVKISWKNTELLKALPEPDKDKVSSINEYKTEKGTRVVVRFADFDYTDFISYVDLLEKDGYKDRNERYHIPDRTPDGTAMFYYSFDGKCSFGIYWRGSGSASGQGCELVICDYNQAEN